MKWIDINNIIGVIGTIGTIIGLILTIRAIKEAQRQNKESKQQTQDIKDIQDSLSTKFIGEFPEYIPEVVKLIEEANSNVTILYGIPTYGLFSRYDEWINYRNTIEKKLRKSIPVKLGYLHETKRREHQREQFALKEGWAEKIKNDYFRERAERFFDEFDKNKKKLEDRNTNEFLALLDKQQESALNGDFKKAQKKEINTSITMNFWIVDKKKAIFTVPNYAERPTELGFSTSDSKLIEAFIAIYNRYESVE